MHAEQQEANSNKGIATSNKGITLLLVTSSVRPLAHCPFEAPVPAVPPLAVPQRSVFEAEN